MAAPLISIAAPVVPANIQVNNLFLWRGDVVQIQKKKEEEEEDSVSHRCFLFDRGRFSTTLAPASSRSPSPSPPPRVC